MPEAIADIYEPVHQEVLLLHANRQWIGIDITQLSIALLKNRLEGNFGMLPVGTKAAPPPEAKPRKLRVAT